MKISTTLALLVVSQYGWAQYPTVELNNPSIKSFQAQSIRPVSHIVHAPSDEVEYISAEDIRNFGKTKGLVLRSQVAVVFDERENEIIFQRHADEVMSVASLTKLMTAMVIIDANLPVDEAITITKQDKDRIKYAKSRLNFGTKLSRADLLLLALLASENRAAAALGRTFPGGTENFVIAMNDKAKGLGLTKTHFMDPAGLHDGNVSTAKELVALAQAASHYDLIREITTTTKQTVTDLRTGRQLKFGNTNRLVKGDSWLISMSKTGFTTHAGNCLVMETVIKGRPLLIILLKSWGKLSKYGDSNRIKKWLLNAERIVRRRQLVTL